MLADNGVGRAQSESGTILLGGEIGIEYFPQVLITYAMSLLSGKN